MAGMAELQQIIQLVEQSLDEPGLDAGELASRACLSRFHFDRLASAALGEPPGAFRRRLLLERAAHRLVSTPVTVIQIGAEAGYTSPDAFTRAFFRAYGTTPTVTGGSADQCTTFRPPTASTSTLRAACGCPPPTGATPWTS